MKRRPFLKLAGGLAGACALGVHPSFAKLKTDGEIVKKVKDVPYRALGRTGMEVSIAGFPGLSMVHQDQEACNKAVANALELGVNFYDVAPAYGNGDAEIKLGNALKDMDRDSYHLACKTKMRDKEGARMELERSLERLHTDHFDLYQMHHLRTTDEVRQAFGPGGCMETFFEAQKEGKVRYLGFSAHTTKSALLAMKNYNFDTVMFPINFIENYAFGFGAEVMDLAAEQGAAVLAIKPMCGGYWPEGRERTRNWWYMPLEDQETITKAMNFTLSKPGVTVGIPPAFLELFEKAVVAAKEYHVPDEKELDELKNLAAESLSVFEERQKQYSHAPGLEEEQSELFKCPYALA